MARLGGWIHGQSDISRQTGKTGGKWRLQKS